MTETNFGWLAQPFAPISLKDLNDKAAMMERIDNKYVVTASTLRRAVAAFSIQFDILQIEGRRSFVYETWYFDDAERRAYFDHHQGRRRRMKVRVRRYVDAGLCFVEVKLKDKRGSTVKKRLPYDPRKYGVLDADAYAHILRSYRDLYQEEITLDLEPVLEVSYRRLTLVTKVGGERMTVDCGLTFRSLEEGFETDEDLFIVETKSANGNGLADKVLRALNQHPTKHCSKYCIGTIVTGGAEKYNKFRPALKRLGVLHNASLSTCVPDHT